MAGVGGMADNTSSQDSEDTSDRRFSPRNQACRKYTTFSDGFIHERIVPGVDKSPKAAKAAVRMNGSSNNKSTAVVSMKPQLRLRSDKTSPESLQKRKRLNSQDLQEDASSEIVLKDEVCDGDMGKVPQHPATPPTSPLSNHQHSGTPESLSPPVLPTPPINGFTKPAILNGVCSITVTPSDCKDTLQKCIQMQPKKNGLQLLTNLNTKDAVACFGPPPISPDQSRACTPPASSSSGNSCRDDVSSKDSSKASETTCQWHLCGVSLEESDLMEHLRVKHVEPQLKAAQASQAATHTDKDHSKFVCLWSDCKVYNKKSSSRTWLERHVVLHAGDKPFKCIVDGCGQRFTSQAALERHVNSHFNTPSSYQNPDNCRTVKHKDDTPSKQTKKKKLRRKRSWLIKTDDYMDNRAMEQIQQSLFRLSQWTQVDVSGDPNTITLHSTVMARRTEDSGKVQLLLHWKPESILPDQWVMESQLSSHQTRTVPLHSLPHDSAVCMDTQFYRQHRYRKHRRK